MKVSYKWLQSYFDKKLPKPEEVARLLTMHSFEIEGVEKVGSDTVLDVKVLPNLAHSCLSHRGVAQELAAIMGMDRRSESIELPDFTVSSTSRNISVIIEDDKLCRRYIARVIENIKVGDSPKWLKDRLESVGQRSINGVVDITNHVLLDVEQPLHVFDADKIGQSIIMRQAKEGERMETLDGKDIILSEGMLVEADETRPLAIAGIKGGKYAEINKDTRNIVLIAGNFDPVSIRKSSMKIGIHTDASKRFENELSPELVPVGIDSATKLVLSVAGTQETKVGAMVSVYPRQANPYKVGVSLSEINQTLGTDISDADVSKILDRAGFTFERVKPIEKVLSLVSNHVGAPYMYGASVSYDAPKAFDCSSLITYLYVQGGVAIPRLSIDQYTFGKPVDQADLQAGDLVFLKGRRPHVSEEVPEGVGHVGMYIGDGKVVHASGPSHHDKVVVESLAEFEASSKASGEFRGYRRILNKDEERFVITVPSERLDIRIKEDLIEEIGRIYGYEKIPSIPLAKSSVSPVVHKGYYYSNKIRMALADAMFTEISTYAMVARGKVELLNPMSEDKAFMRSNLADAMKASMVMNARNADIAGVSRIRLFEIGKVFDLKDEYTHLCIGVCSPGASGVGKKDKEVLVETKTLLEKTFGLPLAIVGESDGIIEIDLDATISELPEAPRVYDTVFSEIPRRFEKISVYPFISRDIAVFLPEGVSGEELEKVFVNSGTDTLLHYRCFDVFTKLFPDGSKKTSYAYRLVFQSKDKTLADTEVNAIMNTIIGSISGISGAEVR